MFAVTVTFNIKSSMMDIFMPLMLDNARTSLAYEPDCHQFDVCTDEALPDTVFLYEVYSDSAGFETHLGTPHFRHFDAATSGMIETKAVCTFATVHQ